MTLLDILLAVELVMLATGIVAAARPHKLNRFFRKVLCAMRLMRRERLETPMPRWRNVLTFVIGMLLIVNVIYDLRVLKVGVMANQVPVWQSDTSHSLDSGLRKEIDDFGRRMVSSAHCMGLVVCVVDGERSWILGYGHKRFGSNVPPDADTIFEIGSVTKTFTALSFAATAERGDVKLNDPVSRFLPKSVRVPDYEGREITLMDLVTHTSGLPSMPGWLRWVGDDPYASYSDDMMYEFLSGYSLTRAPGDEYEYSNMGAGLLGLALSRKAGMSYERMVTSLICKPLGMKDTIIMLSKDQRARLASGYELQTKLGSIEFAIPAENWTFRDCFAGAGAIRSTANDMIKYISANMYITSDTSLPFRITHGKRRDIADDLGMAMGWHTMKLDDEGKILWHNGETAGYHSFVAFSKNHKKGVVILANSASDGDSIDSFGVRLLISMVAAK